jgi:hypothetical protein
MEGQRMRIVVSEAGFIWVSDQGEQHHAVSLCAPAICVFERLDVWRDGAPFDTAAIHQIAEGGYDGFEGLEAIFGEPSQVRQLQPSAFKPGDELRIELLRANIPEADYWSGMTQKATEPTA